MAKVLIIEDQKELRDMYQLMLEQMGHEVATAVDGVQGLHELKASPDLVLLDLSMPTASGDVVLGFIRSTPELEHLRVVVISAHPDADTIAAELGADACLKKPVSLNDITRTVEALIGSN
jgi:CheY-like chemotaxis protein